MLYYIHNKTIKEVQIMIMRLTKNNILFVKRHECDGITYNWYVAMKSRQISDNRSFVNYDETGKSIIKEYPLERLPKAVQAFISQHEEKHFAGEDEDRFQVYMIASSITH